MVRVKRYIRLNALLAGMFLGGFWLLSAWSFRDGDWKWGVVDFFFGWLAFLVYCAFYGEWDSDASEH